jgi:glycosyltransferase involved in cell wall biosynthesis
MSDVAGSVREGEIRVLRLFSRLNIGGPSLHVILLAEGLRARGYRTRLVVGRESSREGAMVDLAREKGVDLVHVAHLGRRVRPLSDFRALLAIMAQIRGFRPTIVHTHTAKAGLLGRLAARFLRVPVVVHTYHGHVLTGYFRGIEAAGYRIAERVLAHWSDCLVAVSEAVKRDLLGLGVGDTHKIQVVPLGLELTGFTGELPRGQLRSLGGVPEDVPFIGIVGRLVPIKDVPTFLAAAVRVLEVMPNARFAVVGDGEERPLLEKQCEAMGLASAVRFCGWQMNMRAVLGDLDVVVNCSRNEGTPVALIEALAAAKPVVATRVGGTPDVLVEGEFGRLVPPAQPEALAQAIIETLGGMETARQRASNGRAFVLARHSISRLLEDVDGLYRALLAARQQEARQWR